MNIIHVGIDIGGTFTDFVLINDQTGQMQTFKVLSTPQDPGRAVIDGLKQAGLLPVPEGVSLEIMHGSTVATNALLERKGSPLALVTTSGFKDVIQIGRQNRPELYNLEVIIPAPLVPPHLRYEVKERVSAEGVILEPLDSESLTALTTQILASGVESVAVCLLFSFLQPEHEQIISKYLRDAGLFVSASNEILPEYREYERMSTTAVNAYVSPVLDRYLGRLVDRLNNHASVPGESLQLQIMQSNGGVITVSEARKNGVHCILSGPAGGVIGAQIIGSLAIERSRSLKLLTFDMGGTSTDVSLIDGAPRLTNESIISGLPIRIPVLDIHTIGAGGGSIASIDLGGALRVGPESAGADPGPACYGQSPIEQLDQTIYATVTDANFVLGRLGENTFLNGSMPLNIERARFAIQALGEKIHFDLVETALGIIEVANAHMERALRVISVERGHDPRDFTLLSFGGAGGLHAAELARGLGIPQVLFPPSASVLSAFGMVTARTIKDFSQTVMLPGSVSKTILETYLKLLKDRANQEMASEGISKNDMTLEVSLDMRYQGQSYELSIPWNNPTEDFNLAYHQQHEKNYGYSNFSANIEIVNLRVRAYGPSPKVNIPSNPIHQESTPVPYKHQTIHLRGNDKQPVAITAPCFEWDRLEPGSTIVGPALIVRSDTTILIGSMDHAFIDPYRNLIVTISPSQTKKQ